MTGTCPAWTNFSAGHIGKIDPSPCVVAPPRDVTTGEAAGLGLEIPLVAVVSVIHPVWDFGLRCPLAVLRTFRK